MTPEMTPEEEPVTQTAAPTTGGGSRAWIGIAVLLGLGLGVLGWQVVTLKKQVAGLEGQLSTAQGAATTARNAAATIAVRLRPLTRRSAAAAVDHAAAGDADEAEECLEQAKQLLAAVENIESCEAKDLRGLVADADIALGGDGTVVAAVDPSELAAAQTMGAG